MDKKHETVFDEKGDAMVAQQITDAYNGGVVEDMLSKEELESIRAKAAAIGSQ